MGNKNSSTNNEPPKKSEEEIMKERWMKLAENSKNTAHQEGNEKSGQITQDNDTNKNVSVKSENTNSTSFNNIGQSAEIKLNSYANIEDKTINTNEIKMEVQPEANLIKPSEKLEKTESRPEMGLEKKESKKIDKEHSTIEKIFRISLQPSDKFTHLSTYQAQLQSENLEEAFRLNDLDNIMMAVISDENKRKNIITYLLETYHRAIEMIERRYRNEFDEKYEQIRKMIASYLALIIYSPENFDLQLNRMDTMRDLTKYYNGSDEEEVDFLISDIVTSTVADYTFMQQVFSYILNIIHMDNMTSKSNFFNCDKIKRNLNIITKILHDFPTTREAYTQEPNFLPGGINGRSLQTSTYLGAYLNLAPFEVDANTLKFSFPSFHQIESDNQVRTYSNKLNNLITEVTHLVFLLIEHSQTREPLLQYVYQVVNSNLDRMKMFANSFTTSSIGFLLNSVVVLLKIFFELGEDPIQASYKSVGLDKIFEIISNVDIMFGITTNNVNFAKFDRVNSSIAKEVISSEMEKQNYRVSDNQFNLTTKLFFVIHNILSYFIKTLDDDYTKFAQQLSEMHKSNQINDPKFREVFGLVRAVDVYFRNSDFMKNLMKFNEVTCILLFTLNNKKYPYSNIFGSSPSIDTSEFLVDFYQNIDTSNLVNLSIMPLYMIKNIFTSTLSLRKFASEALLNDMESTKIIVYFAIIYSSQVDLIQNPHLRSEIFDILLYLFITNPQERNAKQNTALLRLITDPFVKDNLIYSLMRVFIDAERLGTSNQFYEKFSIRHKILYLIENLMKSNKSVISEKFLDFANTHKFDAIKMINLLMQDLTFLIDECIQRLMEIKRYQDLKADAESWNALDEETKQLENDKFKENDQRVKTELKLFNSSMDFMLIICQFCQENFMSLKLAERLANLLNYSLDVFISKKNLKLKISNMHEYGFEPKSILVSIVSIYVSFKDYKDFLELVVQDERAFKIENFERVVKLKDDGKISIDYEKYADYKVLVENLKVIEKDIKAKQVNYDDAPEEFLDPIAATLMEDPVKLPSSGVIVDRTTIETHLLSDPTDPFNRSALRKEELIPCPDLQVKILEYKKYKLQK